MKTKTEKNFEKPRHWMNSEELSEKYWSDPKKQSLRAQEFLHKPIETLEKLEKSDSGGIKRREFLTIMGASMAMATMACSRRPVNKIIPYVVKPEEVTPGVANWYASTHPETGAGLLVKTRESRPIKVEGNPDHPVNQGFLGVAEQASVLNLYDPDRLRGPVKIGSSGTQQTQSWKQIDQAVVNRLSNAKDKNSKVRVLSRDIKSPTTKKLMSEFLSSFADGKHIEFEPVHFSELVESQKLSYGKGLVPVYRFEKADYVLSLGADFLSSSWLSSEEYSKAWAQKRKLTGKNSSAAHMSKCVMFESMMTITGANSDLRYAVRPGDEVKVALAVINEILANNKDSSFANHVEVKNVVSSYTAEKVSQDIGFKLKPSDIKNVAKELWKNRGRSLVVAGGMSSDNESSLSLQVAVNLLNSLLGNEGETVDHSLSLAQGSQEGDFLNLLQEIKQGEVDVLILYRSNLAYFLAGDEKLLTALKKVPFVVSVSESFDETGSVSDFVLADNNYLESWGDSQLRKNMVSLQQPTIAPLWDTRSFENSLLTWTKTLGTGSLASKVKSWHDYLQLNWKQSYFSRFGSGKTFNNFWEDSLQKGVVVSKAYRQPKRSFRFSSLSVFSELKKQTQATLLALYPSAALGDGRSANNAWLQELPDPISTVTWDNYLNVSVDYAKKASLKENDVVRVSAGDVTLELPVFIQPGLHPNVATVAVGYGRTVAGNVGKNVGKNAFRWLKASNDHLMFSGREVKIKNTGKRYQLAKTQNHHRSEGRPIINDITLKEFKKNPKKENHTDPHLRMDTVPTLWPKFKYTGHKWGMAIDLNACNGCGACVVACQAENNITVVGRDNVRVGRTLHWIRIDRYYAGNEQNPDVLFQPMLCQHCDNASCETVCPVLATVHNSEGLNLMVYNRCVGTRYCQNNCPYKVRRFNYFDHWKQYQEPMNQVFNPDVTVRTRGVMEKCSFCIQRIQEAKAKAKAEGRKMKEGDVTPACQQTCASGAIAFGDINDPNSKVTKLTNEQHAFRALETINNKPMISYLTKVRNKEEGADHVDHH